MDWAIQKCCELGVSSIRPLATERTVARIDKQKTTRLERWRTIAAEACRQSGRIRLPEIHAPVTLSEALETLPEGMDLALHFSKEAISMGVLFAERPDIGRIRVFSGPEGGFTDDEARLLQQSGARFVSLGPRVLRAETAPLAALTLLQGFWGDMS